MWEYLGERVVNVCPMCRPLLEAELEAVGIRLNQSFPNVSFKIKKAGGISFNATLKLTKIDQKMVHNILHDYSKLRYDIIMENLRN